MRAKLVNENVTDVLKPKSEKEIDSIYAEKFLKSNGVTIEEAEKIVDELKKLGVDARIYKKNYYVDDKPVELFPYKVYNHNHVLVECPTKETAENVYYSMINNAALGIKKLRVQKSDSSFGNSLSIKEAKELISKLRYKIKIFAKGEHVHDDDKYWNRDYFEWKEKQRKG